MLELPLKDIRQKKNYDGSDFERLYESLFSNSEPKLTNVERVQLLKWAIIFFNSDDIHVRRLGYRIVVCYSNLYKDYLPLYDLSVSLGFTPVSKYIEAHYLDQKTIEKSFFKSFLSSYGETFRDGNKYLSDGQKDLIEFCKNTPGDLLIVAPTSYGKSELMIQEVIRNLGKKICVIVPSKALLAQTKRRLLESPPIVARAKRIITHPEMYQPANKEFVAVLTQERLIRLMHLFPDLSLDILLIDEAHNLLEGSERGTLLVQAILVAKHRNNLLRLKFYTPFIASSKSIETPYSNYRITARQTNEFIKIEKFFSYDAKKKQTLTFYDQFVDKHIKVADLDLDEFEFIQKHKASKNIIYLNKPRQVEEVASKLCKLCQPDTISKEAEKDFASACKSIADYLHPEYNLLSCLKKGIVYHHGKIPEIIRLYVEDIFTKYPSFAFIVTTSTLLEGVNIPAEKMFLLSTKRGRSSLSRSAFKNLTGRVCRFSEIFSKGHGHLRMLEPEIYVINGNYTNKNANIIRFLTSNAKVMPKEAPDKIENPLLILKPSQEETPAVKQALEYVENVERGTISSANQNFEIRYVKSDIAKFCFKNNINEFDIHKNERALNKNIAAYIGSEKIDNAAALLDTFNNIFIKNVIYSNDTDDFTRLQNQAARNFYTMVLDWRSHGSSFKQMIFSFLKYWEQKEKTPDADQLIYVGHSWGEVKRSPDDHVSQYIDLRTKTRTQRINIAIIRIKEEQDFIEYKLMKFLQVLNDLELLDSTFYDRVRYGTSDLKSICLIKNGISMELAKCLLSAKYEKYLQFDLRSNSVKIGKEVIPKMESENENEILIFEVQFHATNFATEVRD